MSEEQIKELIRYTPYTEYSSFQTYVSEEAPNLSLYPISDLPNAIDSKNKTKVRSFPAFSRLEFFAIVCLLFIASSLILWVEGRLSKTSNQNATSQLTWNGEGCKILQTEPHVWRIDSSTKECKLLNTSAFGTTRLFVFPNTAATIHASSLQPAKLRLELKTGRIYLSETLHPGSGTQVFIGGWKVQLTGTKILAEIANTKAYFTLLEGSLDSDYQDREKSVHERLSKPGETMELETEKPNLRKIVLNRAQVSELNATLQQNKIFTLRESTQAFYFKSPNTSSPINPWIVRLKDGRILKGRIKTENDRIHVFSKGGVEILEEKEVFSISK
ncbi:hypothetical protein [Leptospira yasudae]|uniref:Uncharacterized protein n=1 Tax=Leptospira yasudae TaxID=2202201 RepID=A0A6N4QYM6_9LEPT|nr:hypothetical protein [Leptospira yasudae]TGL83052.1 hypothetical protein EHQ77_01995 [Leptospira yasudae]TGL83637.1 hypothetical protein EHQ72_01915 [Leptospira yasudae]TGL85717.1 hypothetical protein EHQ83_07690 [Leptospira yasudae]